MKTNTASSLRLWCIVSCCCLFAPSASAGDFLDFLVPRDELQAITVTDFTPAGHLQRLPSPTAPVYYAAVSAGYRDFGGIIAGERPISPELVNKTVVKVLAKQGYLPVGPNQRPDLVLLWTWGTMNVKSLADPFSSDGVDAQLNEHQMVHFLGGDKLGLATANDTFSELTSMPGLTFNTSDANDLLEVAHHNLYVVAIAAYDVKLRDPKHGVLLWNTRISCPSRSYWLPEALPSMLAMAGPCIGRETTSPVWVRATERFKPEVKLGDPKVLEYFENNKPMLMNASPSH
jgi:hypothetical protein